MLASGGVDKIVKIWDCRMIKTGEIGQVGGTCETQLFGHEYAVRKVQWSPHRHDVLATASYDMTCRVYVLHSLILVRVPDKQSSRWNTAGQPQLIHIFDPHTEFVVGCGWSLYEEGVLASCGWDSRLNVFQVRIVS